MTPAATTPAATARVFGPFCPFTSSVRNVPRIARCCNLPKRGLNLMKISFLLLFAGFVFAAGASAATANSWNARSMASAAKAIHYPKAGARKVTCRGSSSYRCVATYRHHRRRVFHAEWKGQGGWVCAGKTLAGCVVLRHGFVPTSAVMDAHGAAESASTGYVENNYGVTPDVTPPGCTQTAATSWSCGYQIPSGPITVTVTLRPVRGGWVTSAS